MGIKFHSRLSERREELFVVARGEDRPNIIAEVTTLLEAEGLYVSSIAFNLTSPQQDHFSMEIVARGPDRTLEKCLLALESDIPLPGIEQAKAQWPKIRWGRAHMFHIALNTPDRAGIVAAISRVVGKSNGTFVHLLGITENSGDSPEGGTPYFKLRANVAAETKSTAATIIDQLKRSSKTENFGDDLRIITLD
jgi:predicted amino acid-binding ACT domain protein